MSPPKRTKAKNTFLARVQPHWAEILLGILILLGFGLRLIDLTDPPRQRHVVPVESRLLEISARWLSTGRFFRWKVALGFLFGLDQPADSICIVVHSRG